MSPEGKRPITEVVEGLRRVQRGTAEPKGSPAVVTEKADLVADPYEGELPPAFGETKLGGVPGLDDVTVHDLVARVRAAQRGCTLHKGHPDNPKKPKRQ